MLRVCCAAFRIPCVSLAYPLRQSHPILSKIACRFVAIVAIVVKKYPIFKILETQKGDGPVMVP